MSEHSNQSGLAMVAKAIKHRRRTLIVNPAAQRRFVLSLTIPTLLMLLAVGAWAIWLENAAFDDAATTGSSYALPSFLPFGVGMFVAILLFEATIVVQALRVSHRVEGSAYRIVKSMARIRQGDLAFTVTLRKKDHLQEVAAELNRLMDWIRTRVPAESASTAASSAAQAPNAQVEALAAAKDS